MNKKMSLRQAVEETLKEDPRTREKFYDWLFLTEVLRKMGFNINVQFDSKMPHHESITRTRRKIMNEENKFNLPIDKEIIAPRSFGVEKEVKHDVVSIVQ